MMLASGWLFSGVDGNSSMAYCWVSYFSIDIFDPSHRAKLTRNIGAEVSQETDERFGNAFSVVTALNQLTHGPMNVFFIYVHRMGIHV